MGSGRCNEHALFRSNGIRQDPGIRSCPSSGCVITPDNSSPISCFLATFFINALGQSIQDTHINSYVAVWGDYTKMGISHAVYGEYLPWVEYSTITDVVSPHGFGAFSSALVSTQFSMLDRWMFHFIVSLALALLNISTLVYTFIFKTEDECLAQTGREPVEKNPDGPEIRMKQLLSFKVVPLLAAFLFFYVGLEFTMGSWISTYILEELNGSQSVGCVAAGFFAGLTFGSVVLLWVNEKIGERRVVFLYMALAIGLELVVWLIPSRFGSAVAVALVGALLGPLFPITMNHASRVLPRWMLPAAIGWIAGVGQVGPAVLPFMTGVFAEKFGILSSRRLLVGMMATLAALWAIVPARSRLDWCLTCFG